MVFPLYDQTEIDPKTADDTAQAVDRNQPIHLTLAATDQLMVFQAGIAKRIGT